MPIIPMVLANGSEGIGTGWSSYIPNYNPKDIVANVRRLLNDEPMQPMDPWYRGFTVSDALFFLLLLVHKQGFLIIYLIRAA